MDPKKILGKKIQTYRKLRQITQEKLAETIGIDTISLSKIETGRNYPTAENLAKIAKVLDVELYELFIDDHAMSNEELLKEIYASIDKISNDNKKLHILYSNVKFLL